MIFKNENMLEPALGCLNDCQSCMPNNKSFCTSCIQPLLSQDGQCVPECSLERFYRFGMICRGCIENCRSCSGEGQCSQCLTGSFLLDDKQCVKTCPTSYFSNIATQRCTRCGTKCLSCDNSTSCNKCESGYLAY